MTKQFKVLFVYLAIVIGLFYDQAASHPSAKFWDTSSSSSKIYKSLSDLKIFPGDNFKGRLATFTGSELPAGISWLDLIEEDYDYLLESNTDFRGIGPWSNSVPTIFEYSQFLSPQSFQTLVKRMGVFGDKQMRNMLVIRNPNIPLLELIGVKYIVIDRELSNQKLKIRENINGGDLYLYELSNSNLIGIGINKLEPKLTQDFLESGQLLFSSESYPKGKKFDPINTSNLSITKSGYRVSATGGSRSLLIIPVEFSNCFTIDNENVGSKILRVNELLIGLEFSHKIDIDLNYFNGIFKNQTCRLSDYFMFKQKTSGKF